MMTEIPVIDLFAGPGGLGEGFSSFVDSGVQPFRIKLSIEKDSTAHQTLQLRSFFRKFPQNQVPDAYYDYLRQVDIPEMNGEMSCSINIPNKLRKLNEKHVLPS